MAKDSKNKRNTIAVRLNDKDYEAFRENTTKPSDTLRRLIQEYNANQHKRKTS